MSEWRPISEAPRDGKEVLVLLDVGTVPVAHIAFYRGENEWYEVGQYCGGWGGMEDWIGWWSYTTGSVTQEKLTGHRMPTHFQPLPPPPETGR